MATAAFKITDDLVRQIGATEGEIEIQLRRIADDNSQQAQGRRLVLLERQRKVVAAFEAFQKTE